MASGEFFGGMHNLECERVLLGALLMKNDVLDQIAPILSADDFFDEFHARAFAMIAATIQANKPATVVTLRSFFDEHTPVGEPSAIAYIRQLVADVPSLQNIEEYARLVRGLAIRRHAAIVCSDTIEAARDAPPDVDPMSIIEGAEAALFAVADASRTSNAAVPFSVAIDQMMRETQEAAARGMGLGGISTGLSCMDEMQGGMAPGDLIMIAARPGVGKTAYALQVALNCARRGDPVIFFSLEMRAAQLATRIASQCLDVVSSRIRKGDFTDDELVEFMRGANGLRDLPLRVDDTPAISVAQLRLRARRAVRKHGVKLICVDYVQLMKVDGWRGGANKAQEMAEISHGLKSMAKELGVPVLVLAQLNREIEKRDKDKAPRMSDLADASSLEKDADLIGIMQVPDSENDFAASVINMHIVKNRHGRTSVVPIGVDHAKSKMFSTRSAQ